MFFLDEYLQIFNSYIHSFSNYSKVINTFFKIFENIWKKQQLHFNGTFVMEFYLELDLNFIRYNNFNQFIIDL